jgi:hypothetical protein
VRCEVHCPPGAGSVLRGPLLALGALGAASVGVYVASLLGGVLVAAVVVVYVLAVAGAWLFWRLHIRPPRGAKVVPITGQTDMIPALPAAPLAIGAPVPAVAVLGVHDGEIVER